MSSSQANYDANSHRQKERQTDRKDQMGCTEAPPLKTVRNINDATNKWTFMGL